MQENIHTIMESEAQVNALMASIDLSIGALEEVETELQVYEDTVIQVKNAVEKIEEENSQLGTAAKNNQLLLAELSKLIETLDFPAGSSVLNADLSSPQGIMKATEDVHILKEALRLEVFL